MMADDKLDKFHLTQRDNGKWVFVLSGTLKQMAAR